MTSELFRALAAAALDAQGQEAAVLRDRPGVLGTDWLEWYDGRYAAARDHRAGCVRAFIGHAEYLAAHERVWGDVFTSTSTADSAWIPVARLVTNALTTPA